MQCTSKYRYRAGPALSAVAVAWACLVAGHAAFAQYPGPPTTDRDGLISQGEALVEQRVCRSCHRIGGDGGEVGPNLDQVTLRRPVDWLRRWLMNPPAVKPGTLMPIYAWTDEELDAVIAYLEQFRTPVDSEGILGERGTGREAGRALVEAYQCGACHAIEDGTGRPIYPDLNTVAERRTAQWEADWLGDPQAVIPGTFMPTFGFSEQEVEAIVNYLYE